MTIVRTLQIKGIAVPFICLLLCSPSARAETSLDAPAPGGQKAVGSSLAGKDPGTANAGQADAAEHARKGNLLLTQGKFEEAVVSFDRALQLNPHLSAAKTGKGIAFSRKGELVKAEGILKDALLQNPDPIRAHYELGLVYEKMGDLNRATAQYKEGIRKHEQGRR